MIFSTGANRDSSSISDSITARMVLMRSSMTVELSCRPIARPHVFDLQGLGPAGFRTLAGRVNLPTTRRADLSAGLGLERRCGRSRSLHRALRLLLSQGPGRIFQHAIDAAFQQRTVVGRE